MRKALPRCTFRGARHRAFGVFALMALLVGCAPEGAPEPPRAATVDAAARAVLAFQRDGETVATHDLTALQSLVPAELVEGYDPYYQTTKRWKALPLAPLLRAVYGAAGLDTVEFVLRASDGYTVPISGARLLEPGAYVAFADADGPWQPIGPMGADPSPYYLVWVGKDQDRLASHPRPWALATIAIEPFEAVFPKVVPPAGSSEAALRGFGLWKAQCVRCHAINQQGGTVGPELNVPQNVLAYREPAFLRAWIRDPASFRPSAMPSFRHLSDAELDDVLEYLKAMGTAQDPSLLRDGTAH